jgi:hypothetical protein
MSDSSENPNIEEADFQVANDLVVWKTTAYHIFELLARNREVKHASEVRRSVEEVGPQFHLFPIVVTRINNRYAILDGQARYTVASDLGEPVYFIITEDLSEEDIGVINNSQTDMDPKDYLGLYGKDRDGDWNGKKEYVKAKIFLDDYPFFTTAHVRDAGQSGDNRQAAEDWRHGNWTFNCEPHLIELAEKAKDFQGHTDVWSHTSFLKALSHLVRLQDAPKDETVPTRYDHEWMIHQLEKGRGPIEPRSRLADHMQQMQRIFRKGARGWKSDVVFEPQFAEEVSAMLKAKMK